MTTVNVNNPLDPQPDMTAMDLREREGYLRYPQSIEDSRFWEEQAAWPDDERRSVSKRFRGLRKCSRIASRPPRR